MFGFFGREDGKVLEIPTAADLTKRVAALEDSAYATRLVGGGAAKIGANLVSRGGDTSLYAKMLDQYMFGGNSVVERRAGVMIGRPNELRGGSGVRLSDAQAEMLRDWLLKEFPLETPKPEVKKPGGKK